MGMNQTVEAPNFEKIAKEAGQFTSDAINLLWAAINDTRSVGRRSSRQVSETFAPKMLIMTPTASVNDLDLDGASLVSFQGASGQNFTGMKAPETGKNQIVFVHVSGAGTITAKNGATSETQNQLSHESGADVTLSTAKGIIYVYIAGKWREVA